MACPQWGAVHSSEAKDPAARELVTPNYASARISRGVKRNHQTLHNVDYVSGGGEDWFAFGIVPMV